MANLRRLSWATLLTVLCLAGPLGLAAPSSAQNTGNLPADLQALIDEALKANPEVKQMRANYKASKETIKSAGALDDPEVAFEMKDIPVDTWTTTSEPQSQKMLELSQKFPFFGKRRLRSEVAAEQTHSDDYTYQDKVNEVRAKVVTSYWGLSMAYSNFT